MADILKSGLFDFLRASDKTNAARPAANGDANDVPLTCRFLNEFQ